MQIDFNKVYIQVPNYPSDLVDVYHITGSHECLRTIINFKDKTLNFYRNNSDSYGYNFNNYVKEIHRFGDRFITYEFNTLKEARVFLKNFKLINKLIK